MKVNNIHLEWCFMFLFGACHWHCISLSLSAWSLVAMFCIYNYNVWKSGQQTHTHTHTHTHTEPTTQYLPNHIYIRGNYKKTSFSGQLPILRLKFKNEAACICYVQKRRTTTFMIFFLMKNQCYFNFLQHHYSLFTGHTSISGICLTIYIQSKNLWKAFKVIHGEACNSNL